MSHAYIRSSATRRTALAILVTIMAVLPLSRSALPQVVPQVDGKQTLESEHDPGPSETSGRIRVPPPSGHSARGGAGASPHAAATSSISSSWWLGSAGIAAILAICGAIRAGARGNWPQAAMGELRIVGRVNLSPRHSIVLVQMESRVLLLGLGPQSAPTLLSDLPSVDVSETSDQGTAHPLPRGEFPAAGERRWPAVDIRLGGEE